MMGVSGHFALSLSLLGLAFWGVVLFLQTRLTWYGLRHFRSSPAASTSKPPVSCLKPLKGVFPGLEENLESFFRIDYPEYELIFSTAHADDPAAAVVRSLMGRYPHCRATLVVSPEGTVASPKVSTLLVPFAEAAYDWVVLSDANVRVEPDYLLRISRYLVPSLGLLSAIPAGRHASGWGGHLDAILLNTFYARGMLFCQMLGRPVAAAKSQCFRRSEALRFGGLEAVGDVHADDVRLGKLMSGLGLRVQIMAEPIAQSCGQITFGDFWERHLRWGRNRKALLPRLFWLEPIQSVVGSGIIGALAWHHLTGISFAGVLLAHLCYCLALDWLLVRRLDPEAGWRSAPAWVLAKLLRVPLWAHISCGRTVRWGGRRWRLGPGGTLQPLS